MQNGIQKIEKIIEYIENNITSDMNYEEMASIMTLSVYEFRRIFAFIVGCPISEYIRKRRLSVAACELMANPDTSIQTISEKYGYSTLSAFSKAFSEYHGFPPTVCQKGNCEIKLFFKPKFDFHIQNGIEHTFGIISDTAFNINGYSAVSEYSDTCCCENVWNDFYELEKDKELKNNEIYVAYDDKNGKVYCTMGDRAEKLSNGNITIKECRWLCVKMNTTDDDIVNEKYNTLLYELIPSAKLKRKIGMPTLEVFPIDMSEENFEWEIRIPIE